HWKANCPFHQEKSPSFMVNEERQMWHCFGCGKGGDAFAFVMEIEGLDFKEALRLLADKAGVKLEPYQGGGGGSKEEKDRSHDILELSTKFFEKQLWESDRGKKMLDYLHGRGLTDGSIHQFRLGYAPDGWRYLLEFLLKQGYAAAEIEKVGLIIQKSSADSTNNSLPTTHSKHYDRFRDRIMFPIMDILGRVIGYSARVAPGGDESQAKYINTPETPLYHKSRALYGIQLAKQTMKEKQWAVLVEGNMDVIAMHQAGIKNTVAVSGTALTHDQLQILGRYGKKLKLFFDMDSAGQAAAWKSAGIAYGEEFTVEMVALPHGKDAADMNQENPEGLVQAITAAKPAFGYFLEQLLTQEDTKHPTGKRTVAERGALLLSTMKNDIERSYWMKSLAEQLDIEERVIRGLVDQAMKDIRQGTDLLPKRSSQSFLPKAFGRRSELLREEIIALMLVGKEVRQIVLGKLVPETRTVLATHPLFFFLENAVDDPMGAIEDVQLKEEASRLTFRALAIPTLSELDPTEQGQEAARIVLEYLDLLDRELSGSERRRTVARELEAARVAGDKTREKELLKEFVTLTGTSLPSA
ncbi:MAG: DNA primase, partial [Candidatus Zixiibacteriota bacterium]